MMLGLVEIGEDVRKYTIEADSCLRTRFPGIFLEERNMRGIWKMRIIYKALDRQLSDSQIYAEVKSRIESIGTVIAFFAFAPIWYFVGYYSGFAVALGAIIALAIIKIEDHWCQQENALRASYKKDPPENLVRIRLRVLIMASLNALVIGLVGSYILLSAMHFFNEARK